MKYTEDQKLEILSKVDSLIKSGKSQTDALKEIGFNDKSYRAWKKNLNAADVSAKKEKSWSRKKKNPIAPSLVTLPVPKASPAESPAITASGQPLVMITDYFTAIEIMKKQRASL